MTHKLMIKTHNKTNLKYLCYTRSEGEKYNSYKGSGTRWKKHLKKYGDEITTELIFETNDKEAFVKEARAKSIEFNVVESEDWANLKLEEGDGGDTVSNKVWITNDTTDKYINKDDEIPQGWRRGRCKCVFNDRKKQIEFAARCDTKFRGKKIKEAWDSGKMDHIKRNPLRGDKNPACRPEVKKKIGAANSKKIEIDGIAYDSIKIASDTLNITRYAATKIGNML